MNALTQHDLADALGEISLEQDPMRADPGTPGFIANRSNDS
jgi:hypothetical protein